MNYKSKHFPTNGIKTEELYTIDIADLSEDLKNITKELEMVKNNTIEITGLKLNNNDVVNIDLEENELIYIKNITISALERERLEIISCMQNLLESFNKKLNTKRRI